MTKKQKERVEKWVEALKSGKFKQAQHVLRVTNSKGKSFYCCLGVACEIYRQETGKGKWENDKFAGNTIRLPLIVKRWFGLRTDEGAYFHDTHDTDNAQNVRTELSSDNDNGKSFKAIAKIIESKPQGLFV